MPLTKPAGVALQVIGGIALVAGIFLAVIGSIAGVFALVGGIALLLWGGMAARARRRRA